ncbi:MAG: formylglycine-generating enzyme family protein [Proteobacteria bacterium]|nr:formylglycine-generating enzyme family protein [Pseudomonadota bacterium]
MIALLLGLAAAAPLVPIEGGKYLPLYPPDPEQPVTDVASFQIDATPVTRAEFAAFVTAQPKWQRGQVAALFAERAYLSSWATPTDPGGRPNGPVTEVSWFAARAYCAAEGKRLPTEDEWEYVARASETSYDATQDDAWLGQILSWYAKPGSDDPPNVGQGMPNLWGVHDQHGVVWEWVEDFNNTLFGTDGREGGDEDELRFCGSGTLSATDVRDYARFMRIAFRSSLQGTYTTAQLGFRCAADGVTP